MSTMNEEKDKEDQKTLRALCERMDFDGIKSVLEHQTLLNEAISLFDILLMLACNRGWDELVEYLLSNSSNTLKVNIKTQYGYTALYYAVEEGRIKCVRLLLSHPNIDVNTLCGEFNKPVLWYCGNRECYDLLLPYYPTIHEYDKKMARLWSLSSYRITPTVEVVKDIMATIPREALHQMKDDVSVMVCLAAEKGNAAILEYLLSSYSDIIDINKQDKYGKTALTRAIRSWQIDCVKLLLASPNINLTVLNKSRVSDALARSVTDNEPEILKALLDCPNIDVNEMFDSYLMEGTLLCFAVVGGRVDCVKLLLSHRDIDVNITCEEFDKPVLWYCGNRECYDLLLPYYPTINKYEKKMAWLYSLCLSGKGVVKEVKKLMNDFTLNDLGQIKDDVSMLIMSLVLRRGKGEIIEYLLSIIGINYQNKDGNTVLYQAARYAELDMVKFLLAQPNINVNINTGEFDKPVLWYCGNRECYDLLLPYYTTINEYEKKMAWLWSLLHSETVDVKEVENILETIPRKALHQMKDDASVMVWLAAETGKADILEYLLSSYGDIIDINIQDKVHDVAFVIAD